MDLQSTHFLQSLCPFRSFYSAGSLPVLFVLSAYRRQAVKRFRLLSPVLYIVEYWSYRGQSQNTGKYRPLCRSGMDHMAGSPPSHGRPHNGLCHKTGIRPPGYRRPPRWWNPETWYSSISSICHPVLLQHPVHTVAMHLDCTDPVLFYRSHRHSASPTNPLPEPTSRRNPVHRTHCRFPDHDCQRHTICLRIHGVRRPVHVPKAACKGYDIAFSSSSSFPSQLTARNLCSDYNKEGGFVLSKCSWFTVKIGHFCAVLWFCTM